jgi:outer membrane protein assembly factor BamD (BamD/ComL family)
MFRFLRPFLLLACALALSACVSGKPYVDTLDESHFHLFHRPDFKNPADQWDHVLALAAAGKEKAAAKQAYALRITWPEARHAAEAQLMYARWLDRRGKLADAAEQYELLLTRYPTSADFASVLEDDMRIARALFNRRVGKFLFFPGVDMSEKSIPHFEFIVKTAPEGELAAEALLLAGRAYEAAYKYPEAIDSYLACFNRFPRSPHAEPALFAQASCYRELAGDSPNDARALDMARAASSRYVKHFPDGPNAGTVRSWLKDIHARQERMAFDRAEYYDKILKRPDSARIAYEDYLARFPTGELADRARLRLSVLPEIPAPTPGDNP